MFIIAFNHFDVIIADKANFKELMLPYHVDYSTLILLV